MELDGIDYRWDFWWIWVEVGVGWAGGGEEGLDARGKMDFGCDGR